MVQFSTCVFVVKSYNNNLEMEGSSEFRENNVSEPVIILDYTVDVNKPSLSNSFTKPDVDVTSKETEQLIKHPLVQIKSLIKLNPSVSKLDFDAVFAISEATELFITMLGKEASKLAEENERKTILKKDIDDCISSCEWLAFLEEEDTSTPVVHWFSDKLRKHRNYLSKLRRRKRRTCPPEDVILKYRKERKAYKIAIQDAKAEAWKNVYGSSRSLQRILPVFSDDFRKLSLDDDNCNIVIDVKGKIINAHEQVLKAYPNVNLSVLRNAKNEDSGSVIKVDDCEPEHFEAFLHYLYTREVKNLSDINMLGIYDVAVKYNVLGLRAESLSYIKQFMSVENIFHVMRFAKKHGDSELLNCVIDFFLKKVDEGMEIAIKEKGPKFEKGHCVVADKTPEANMA